MAKRLSTQGRARYAGDVREVREPIAVDESAVNAGINTLQNHPVSKNAVCREANDQQVIGRATPIIRGSKNAVESI